MSYNNNSTNFNFNVTSGSSSSPDNPSISPTRNSSNSTLNTNNYNAIHNTLRCLENGSNHHSGSNSTSTILQTNELGLNNDYAANLSYDNGYLGFDYQGEERIDYSNALLKENKNSQNILSKLNADVDNLDSNRVYTGFAENFNDHQLDVKTQNQLVFDVLPSFEMYHSFQYSAPNGSFENPNDFPPDYFHKIDAPNYAASSIGSESALTPGIPSSASNNFDNVNDDFFSSSALVTPAISTTSTAAASSYSVPCSSVSDTAPVYAPATPSPPPATPDTHPADATFDQEIEKNIIDKAHTLPNYDSFDIKVDVFVTKDVPCPNQKPEMESMLKEYTSGDVVHGYVVVQNTSDEPLEFQMFHVTLEGYTSIIDEKNRKQIVKRFLTMVDLSASWSSGCISPSSNISFEALSKDSEGCILGLRNDRVLEPHTKYKKFFTFKFPYNLLDNVCRHQHEVHTLLPPSFGVDTVKRKHKNADIDINPVTHYGHLGSRGSPLLTNDLSQPNLSVSYGINARLIGISPRQPTKLSVLKDQEYSLRFIPFGFAVPLYSSKTGLNLICENIEHEFKIANDALKLKIEGEKDRYGDDDVKIQQLGMTSSSASSIQDLKFPLRNKSLGGYTDEPKVETQLTYLLNGSVTSSFLRKLKGGKKSSVDSTKSGLITVSTSVPKDGLPYRSPPHLRKTNEISNLSEAGYKNYDSLSSSLSMNEKRKLSSLKLHFNFLPSDHSMDLVPPEIKSIKPSLIVMNIFSSSSIPIKLSSDLFASKDFNKLKTKFEKYFDTYNELESKFESNSLSINDHLDTEIMLDIKSMKDIQVEKHQLAVFDYSMNDKQNDWKHSDDPNVWEKNIDLSLNFKDNISETLVPNFQGCLLSRVYCINVNVVFKNGQSCELVVPIRIRKFDDF